MIGKEDAYTRNEAYNFLKDLLGIPRKSFINKNFFNLFFIETQGFYVTRKHEEFIKKLFTEKGVVELNKAYYQMKMSQKPLEAQQIVNTVMQIIEKSFAA